MGGRGRRGQPAVHARLAGRLPDHPGEPRGRASQHRRPADFVHRLHHPELARVGLSETEARRAGYDVQVARLPVAAIPRARTLRQTEGMWKAVIDAGTDRILGVALLGAEAGEVVTSVQVAMLAGMPWTALRDAVITHPTMAEGLNLLFASLQARPVR
ncbi:hypothetical protein [Micromonospora sp. WMMD710]|uniref:hypothetical protein n=1 Tax=Micromonospora sp. WMMD710 TaxID=3016085 RepID=UPI003242214B